MKLNKKANMAAVAGVTALVSLVVVLVIYAIVASFSAEITSDIREDFVTSTTNCGLNSTGGTDGSLIYTACGFEYNISTKSLEGMAEVSEDMPTVSKITVAALIIAIILAAFGGFVTLRN